MSPGPHLPLPPLAGRWESLTSKWSMKKESLHKWRQTSTTWESSKRMTKCYVIGHLLPETLCSKVQITLRGRSLGHTNSPHLGRGLTLIVKKTFKSGYYELINSSRDGIPEVINSKWLKRLCAQKKKKKMFR